MPNKIKHLEMIQDIIKRMATNSFFLKGWSITLTAGIFALASKSSDNKFFLVTYMPLITFWMLDTYYLRQERIYRNLYDEVRKVEEDNINFSLKITSDLLTPRTNYFKCLFSMTEWLFYLPTILLTTAILYIM